MSDKIETKAASPMMTNVKGYFNPNPYRVNVAISELNMSVQLEPMEFILERGTNRKINDPLLDKYVGYKMLSPELSNGPVPVVNIPRIPTPQASLHVVGQGVRGPDGKWALPAPGAQQTPQSMVQVPPSVSKPSVAAMSMEEARRRGFVGKVKLVDENYGAAETDGAPTRGDAIPRIKYAMESRAPLAQPGQLPQELVEQVQPGVAPIIAGLQKAAQQDPESVNLGRRAAEAAVAEQKGEEGVKQFRAAVKTVKAKRMPAATMPPPAQATPAPTIVAAPGPRRRVAQVVQPAAPVAPPPAPSPMPVAAESPLVGGRPAGLPAPVFESEEEAAPAPAPAPAPAEEAEPAPTPADATGPAYKCGACERTFQFRSYYIRHIQRAHKDRLAELMPK